jgi:hypothetical protein
VSDQPCRHCGEDDLIWVKHEVGLSHNYCTNCDDGICSLCNDDQDGYGTGKWLIDRKEE